MAGILTLAACCGLILFPILWRTAKNARERANPDRVYKKKFLYDHERTNALLDLARAEGEYDILVVLKWIPLLAAVFLVLEVWFAY